MIPYKNLEGHSGVTGYENGPDSITVEFKHDALYKYTYKSAGEKAVTKMKEIAEAGRGLSTYISRHVRNNYEH